jgi:hypothetical protein
MTSALQKRLAARVGPSRRIEGKIQSRVHSWWDETETVKSNRVHEVSFEDTIAFADGGSCVHRVKLSLGDMQGTVDHQALFVTLNIERHTVFYSGQLTSSAPAPTGRISNDIYERRIRLFNGIEATIQISSEEDSFVVLPTFESFKILAEW